MTASGYAIRAYRPGDEGVIVDMFNRVFGTADPEFRPRDVAYFDWKYLKNPAGFHSLVAEDPDGRVVAHYGGVPIAMRVDGASTAFGQNCDAYSDPAIGADCGIRARSSVSRRRTRRRMRFPVSTPSCTDYPYPSITGSA